MYVVIELKTDRRLYDKTQTNINGEWLQKKIYNTE